MRMIRLVLMGALLLAWTVGCGGGNKADTSKKATVAPKKAPTAVKAGDTKEGKGGPATAPPVSL